MNNFEKIILVGALAAAVFVGGRTRHSDNQKGIVPDSTLASVVNVSLVSTRGQTAAALLFGSEASARPDFYPVRPVSFPNFTGAVALVSNLETGETYFESGAAKRWPIASITKLMTATVAAEILNPAAIVAVEETDAATSPEAKLRAAKAGESYSVRDLLNIMLLASSNEAAEALARSFGRERFIALMNERAVSWGLRDTHFGDPTGLSVSNQSTGRDLEKLAAKIHALHPEIFLVTEKPSAFVTDRSSGREREVRNINLFSGSPDFLGGKTGFIDDSKGNLLSIFSYGGKPILTVVLGSDDRFGETDRLISWFKNVFSPGS